MKFMQAKKLKKGDLVVVNPLPDAVIYTVESVDHVNVSVTYKGNDGTVFDGGTIDCSYLQKPNAKQLKGLK